MFIGSWRSYQRPLIIFIFSGVIFTFVFWGMGDPSTFIDALRGQGQQHPSTLGMVGGEPIMAEEFHRALERVRQQQAQFGGEPPSNQELWETGAVWAAWDELVNEKLVAAYAKRGGLEYHRPFLIEQLKSMPDFQLADGEFDARAWNEWVTNPRVDWSHWYALQGEFTNRQLFAERALASARVLESELRERYALENTEFSLRYANIEPLIEPTDEAIIARFEEDPTRYYHPQQWKASFVRLDLEPDISQDLAAIESLAQGGESMANLAELYFGEPLYASHSELGWIELNDNLPELRKPLLELAVGEASSAIRSGAGYLVYRVLEESFEDAPPAQPAEPGGEEPGTPAPVRSVRVDQLVLRPQLAPEEREAIVAEAEEVLESARATEDLEALAQHFGLEFHQTGIFDGSSAEIEGVRQADLFAFRSAFQRGEPGEVTDLIRGSLGLYIARIDEKPERIERTLDEVRDKVAEDVVQTHRSSPEYREEVRALGLEVRDAVDSLDAIPDAFPELGVMIEVAQPFTVGSFSFASGLRWNVREIAEAAAGLEPGELAGPFGDFIGMSVYFIELLDQRPPTEEDWAERWPQERQEMLDMATRMAQNQQFQDYMLYLRDRAVEELVVTRNDAQILRYLGLSQTGAPAVPATEDTK